MLTQTDGMTPKKLSETDRQDIINIYRQTEETTSTLAVRYGVSTSTISRILKTSLPEDEYEALIQQKRNARSQGTGSEGVDQGSLPLQPLLELDAAETPATAESLAPVVENTPASGRRQRRRVTGSGGEATAEAGLTAESTVMPSSPTDASAGAPLVDPYVEGINVLEEKHREDLMDREGLGEDEDDLDEEDLDDDDLDDLDDLDDDDLDDEGLDDGEETTEFLHIQPQSFVQVLPLSSATIPKTFYLVIDRGAELITRPLRDFGVLGQIPEAEIQERTLPIFDNHRIARRFSKKTQRVIKVPDGKMLQKVGPYLQAKGITRLLIDGQVYSL